MRLLVVTAALAAVVASPALAQSTRREPVQQYQSRYDQSYRFDGRQQAAPSGNDVYEAGQYLGTDPEPNVRLELRRDADHGGS